MPKNQNSPCGTCGANLTDGSGDGVNGHWQNCTDPAIVRELTAALRTGGTLDYPASPTPVADALQAVDRLQAPTTTRRGKAIDEFLELAALRDLADAVRSHGIGAELGQLRELRTALADTDRAARELDAVRDACEDDDAAEDERLDALLSLRDAVHSYLG
jgi:hypothetical protein